MTLDDALLAVHRDPRKVADMLVRSRQDIEQGGFAAVLLAGQGQGQHGVLRLGIFVVLGVIYARFTQTRMGVVIVQGTDVSRFGVRRRLFRHALDRSDHNPGGVGAAQGQGIAVDPDFYRIAHGGALHHFGFSARDQAHVQEMLSQGTFAPDRHDHSGISDMQVIQSHTLSG